MSKFFNNPNTGGDAGTTYLTDLAIANSAAHAWFDINEASPYIDVVGSVDLSAATERRAKPLLAATGGFFTNVNATSTTGVTTGANIPLSRDADRGFELLFYHPNTAAVGDVSIVQLGEYSDAEAWCILRYSSNQLYLMTPAWNTIASGPTAANMQDKYVYLCTNFDSATNTAYLYWNIEGAGEGSASGATTSSGTGANKTIWFGGNGANISSLANAMYFYGAFYNAQIDATHRNNIYSALGW